MPSVEWRETATDVERPSWIKPAEGPYRITLNDEPTGFVLVIGPPRIGNTSDYYIFRDDQLKGIVADLSAGGWFAAARGRLETTGSRDEAMLSVLEIVHRSGGAI